MVDTLEDLVAHGFELRPFDEARASAAPTRMSHAAALEYLIDDLLCLRGFRAIDSSITSWASSHEPSRDDSG